MDNKMSESEMLDALDAADAGEGKTVGMSWEMRAKIFIKRNHYNVPVKTVAEIVGKTHSRVTEVAGGRDYKRYKLEDRAEFVKHIQAEYAKIGLVYTGDFCGNNSSKKLPKGKATIKPDDTIIVAE